MEDYSWEELTKLYETCIILPEEKQKTYLLEHTEHNLSLRKRLTEMLAQDHDSESYFDNLMRDIAEGLETEVPDLVKPGEIINNYKIIEKIGVGGSSQVFVAERVDGQFDKKVAVKIFKKKESSAFADKTKNEKQFLASLSHPSIAQIFDGGTLENGHPFIIMELIEGLTLREYLSDKKLDAKECLRWFSEICGAVREAHNNLILHLDIKPGNVIIEKDQRIKLLDFGIAQNLMDSEPIETTSKLTFNFAAPEQFDGKPLSVQTDIYQLGLLLYYLLSNGQILEGQKQAISLLERADSQVIPSKELLSIVKKCLQQETESRYQSVDQLLTDIERYQHKYPVSSYSNSQYYKAQKYLQRNSIATLLLILVFLSLIGGTIVSVRQAKIAQGEKEKAEKTAEFIKDLFISTSPLSEGENYKELSVFDFLELKKTNLFNDENITAENKWELLSLLFETYINLPEMQQATEVASKMYKLAFEENNSDWILESTHKQALSYSMSYNFTMADSLYQDVYIKLEELKKYNKEYSVQVLSDLGLNFLLQRNYDSSGFYLQQAIALSDKSKVKDFVTISTAYHYYSQVKRSLGDLDSALFYASNALEYKIQEYGSSDLRLSSDYSDRAAIYADMEKYSLAEADLLRAINIDLNVLDSSGVTVIMKLANYATLLSYQKEYVKAAHLTERLFELRTEKYGLYSFDNAFLCLNLTKYYSALKNYALVEKKISIGLEILDSLEGYPPYVKGLFLLAQSLVEIKANDPSGALVYLEECESLLTPLMKNPNSIYQEIINYRKGAALVQLGQTEKGEKLIKQSIAELKEKGGNVEPYITEAQGYLKLISN